MARWGFVLMCFSLAISRSLFAAASLLTLTGWIFSGQWQEKWIHLKRQPVGIAWVTLVAWIFFSLFWSEGVPQTIRHGMDIHWKLLFIPIALTLITTRQWLDRCWNGFAAGMLILLAHIYLLTIATIPWAKEASPSAVFFNPLPQSIGLSIFSAWCLDRILSNSRNRLYQAVLSAILVATAYALFQLSIQRLGYISFIGGCAAVLTLRLPVRHRLASLAILAMISISIAALSPKIKDRIEQARQDIQSYNYKNNYSSLGARLHMWYVSANAIQAAPLLGHGVGSYPIISERAFDDPRMCAQGCGHPHNQYLFYTMEFGTIGLAIFSLALLLAISRAISATSLNERPISIAILFIFTISSLADTTLWYRGYLYLFIVSLSLAAVQIPPPEYLTKKTDE